MFSIQLCIKLFCAFYHLPGDINRNSKLSYRHCEPDRISTEYCREQIDQDALMTSPRATEAMKAVFGFISAWK